MRNTERKTKRDRKKIMRKLTAVCLPVLLLTAVLFSGCSGTTDLTGGQSAAMTDASPAAGEFQGGGVLALGASPEEAAVSETNIPSYTGEPYVTINGAFPVLRRAISAKFPLNITASWTGWGGAERPLRMWEKISCPQRSGAASVR